MYFGGDAMGVDEEGDDDDEEEEDEEEEEEEEEGTFDVATLTPEELYLNDAGQMVFETTESQKAAQVPLVNHY